MSATVTLNISIIHAAHPLASASLLSIYHFVSSGMLYACNHSLQPLRIGVCTENDFLEIYPGCQVYQCVCVLSLSAVSNSLQLMDYSPPGSSSHENFQARILEWGAISSSRESF